MVKENKMKAIDRIIFATIAAVGGKRVSFGEGIPTR